ncbi:YitT family protein [Marinitoga arctica]
MGKNFNFKKEGVNYIIITIGTVLTALGIVLFLDPFSIVAGGVSGLAIVLKNLFGWWLGLQMLIYNIFLFALGFWLLGIGFGFKSIYSATLLSFLIDYFEQVLHLDTMMKDLLLNSPFRIDPLLISSIYGGVLAGVGLGLVIWRNASTGGTDIIAMIINKYFHISTGKGLLIVDTFVTMLAFLINPIVPMFGVITIFVTSKMIDTVVEGFEATRTVFVISKKYDKIKERILNDLDRGVTILEGEGGYTLEERKILMVVLTRREIGELRRIIKNIDDEAFISIIQNSEALGYGFKKLR